MNSLKIAYVVQRYGPEVNGGSETHCRLLAERMARTHRVDLLTTRAVDYTTWKNEYPEGVTELNGVCVRRFGVDHPRNLRKFNKASRRIFHGPHTEEDEVAWMKLQGPYSSRLLEYIAANRGAYDVFVFQTYLYATTFGGLPLVADRAILVPTAHDELPMYLGIFDKIIPRARRVLCLTPEELAFLRRRFPQSNLNAEVIGVGLDPPPAPAPDSHWDRIRNQIGESPFILYVGRIDESKGCKTLFEYFERYIAESQSVDLKLVMVGKPVMSLPNHPRVVVTGFVPEATKFHAIRNCRLMVLPSPYESLCIAALEAWMLRKPVLANGNCAVLRGQCMRSNGGLWYSDYPEFREGMNELLGNDRLSAALGCQGERFVRNHCAWEQVDGKLDRILYSVASSSPQARAGRTAAS